MPSGLPGATIGEPGDNDHVQDPSPSADSRRPLPGAGRDRPAPSQRTYLLLTFTPGERLLVGEDVAISVRRLLAGRVVLTITAPYSVAVFRAPVEEGRSVPTPARLAARNRDDVVLDLAVGEMLVLGPRITVRPTEMTGKKVTLATSAPRQIAVDAERVRRLQRGTGQSEAEHLRGAVLPPGNRHQRRLEERRRRQGPDR